MPPDSRPAVPPADAGGEINRVRIVGLAGEWVRAEDVDAYVSTLRQAGEAAPEAQRQWDAWYAEFNRERRPIYEVAANGTASSAAPPVAYLCTRCMRRFSAPDETCPVCAAESRLAAAEGELQRAREDREAVGEELVYAMRGRADAMARVAELQRELDGWRDAASEPT